MTQLTARLQNEQPRLFSDVATLLGSAITYTAGSNNTVTAGQIIQTQAEGISYQVAPEAATDQHVTTAGGAKLYRVSQRNIEVTVGGGGQFSTINAALSFLDGQRRTYGSNATATIRLLSGFVMAEQVIVRGQDLGWITIVSDASPVSIQFSALTQNVADKDGNLWRPAFFADNGVIPTIGCLFSMTAGGGGLANGLLLINGSGGLILPNCGIENAAGRGAMLQGSSLVCNGASFRNSIRHNLYLENGSKLTGENMNLDRDVSNTSSFGNVFVIYNSHLNVLGSSIQNARGNAAAEIRDGSIGIVRDCNISGASNHGVWCYRSSFADAKGSTINNSGNFGVFCEFASLVDASEAIVNNSGNSAVRAQWGGHISFGFGSVTNAGAAAIFATDGGTIEASSTTLNLQSFRTAFFADRGGVITANSATATNCDFGARTGNGGTIIAIGSTFTGMATAGVRATGGRIDINGTNCRRSVGVDGTSDIQCFDGGIVNAITATGGISSTPNTITSSGIIFK